MNTRAGYRTDARILALLNGTDPARAFAMLAFAPIAPSKKRRAPLPQLLKPTPAKLPKGCGVQLSDYKMREFDALLAAGSTGTCGHCAVQSAIQKDRGGVLPINWNVALAVKENVETMERALLHDR